MKIKAQFLLIISFCWIAFAQNPIIIDIENLKKPEKLLPLSSNRNIINKLILLDNNLHPGDTMRTANFPYSIIAVSPAPDSLVAYDYHSFFTGMYQAYADHRPFVISPDMIWLLICQGFCNHINSNSDELRRLFVNHADKQSIVVVHKRQSEDQPETEWEQIIDSFSKGISDNLSKELVDALTCTFSTTSSVEKIASEVTMMESFKSYFEYVVIMCICGIPKVTLLGTTEDWEKVYAKANSLRKYKLDWWIDDINPILLQIIEASKGKVNKDFWRNMFKYHTLKEYGAPKVIDGWILKFYPYDIYGKKRKSTKFISPPGNLPNEIVRTNVKLIQISPDGSQSETPIELWAGFIGLEQNPTNFALKPQIGWFIRKKNSDYTADILAGQQFVTIRVKKFPEEILQIPKINSLELNFLDSISIPKEIKKIKIESLSLTGTLSSNKADDLLKLLENIKLLSIRSDSFTIMKDFRDSTHFRFEDSRKKGKNP